MSHDLKNITDLNFATALQPPFFLISCDELRLTGEKMKLDFLVIYRP